MKLFFSIFFITIYLMAADKTLSSIYNEVRPFEGVHVPGVDTTTLDGKVMCGYQGWFNAEGDGADSGWRHYGNRNMGPGNCTFEYWPELSEFSESEKYPTRFKHEDGSTASLFSSYNQQTVERHFQWMKDYGIDGVFLQRFGASVKSSKGLKIRNKVTLNVQHGANKYGRTWANMYDLTGLRKGEIKRVLMEDWKFLVDGMQVLKDKSYLHHKGKPVISIWGIGFGDGRDYTLEECEELIDWLKNDPKYGGLTVMVGVPYYWRELKRDSVKDQKLHSIIQKADIVSPWSVGRYGAGGNTIKASQYLIQKTSKADLSWTKNAGVDYLPVIFPGFSWQNLEKARGRQAKLNHIPRLKGEFFWSQAATHVASGVNMLYVAMFDEIDEGTAIFKCSNNPPVGASKFLTYEDLPSDHYLWLSGEIKKMLKSKSVISIPIRPKN